ncbi:SDR family oxidoreductase [Actinomadura sp. K4S16]|uniref:SDR family oxidoreductase n=1 Tax=Actinomadura sp. K4S16 TaxID=1316147 RepID=UPI00190F22AE|nr:SDR family oxidoreductase [Actinomadura sp. K4S16]
MILVTGAGGAVGSALLGTLRDAGQPVRAAYHAQRDVDRAVAAGLDAVRIDLGEPATLPAALRGVDVVFLVSAMGPDQTRHELNLIEAATAAGVSRVVKLSVWRADEELTPIGRLHRPAEVALQASGLRWTFLRPNFYMQNFSRQFAASIRTTGRFAQPRADAPISFVDVRDIARAASHVLTTDGHDGRVHALTGPEALTYDQAAEVLSRVLDRPVRFVGLSDDEARAAMLERGLPAYHADALIEVSRAYRNGGAEAVTTAVRDLTGREPTTFEQFARDHRAAFL